MSVFYLVGARASGKTTVGKLLAARLGLDFSDTDALVVENAGRDIAGIVESEGWDAFRARESAVLAHCAQTPPAQARSGKGGGMVVATGGGMVLSGKNRDLMRATGITFYLRADAEALAARLESDPLPGQRPAFADRKISRTLTDEVRTTLDERESLYRSAADHVLDATRPPEKIVETILELLHGGVENT